MENFGEGGEGTEWEEAWRRGPAENAYIQFRAAYRPTRSQATS